MAVNVGTAFVALKPDFKQFDAEVKAKLHEHLTQEIHVKADASSMHAAEQHVKSFRQETDKAHFSVGQFTSGIRALYMGAAKVTAVGLGSQAISALGAAAISTTAALAPLSGALAAYPAVASAGVQAVGTWKLAFSGVSTAVGGLNNEINKNSQAWKSLTPEGKKFAEQLQAMKKPLRELSAESQKGLMPGLEKGMDAAMKNFPILKQGIADTAKTMGGLATEAGKLVGSKGFGKDLETQMNRNNVTIKRLGEAGLYLGDALRHIVIAAGPLVDWLTKVALEGAKQIDVWAKAGRESGKFAAFFKETKAVMQDVGTIAGDLGKGLFNVFKLAYPEGKSFLDVQVKLADKFKDWTASAGGQNKIKQFFHDARPAMDEVEKLIGALLGDLGKLGAGTQVAPLLHTLRVDLLPKLYEMVDSTTKAFGPAFIAAVTQFVGLWTQLGGSSGPLISSVKLFGEIAKSINWLLQNIPGLKPIIMTLAVAGGIAKALGLTSAIRGITQVRTQLRLMRIEGALTSGAGAEGILPSALGISGGGAGKITGKITSVVSRGLRGAAVGGGLAILGTTVSQALGSAVPGGVGKGIAKIGTDASIGAGIGSFFGVGGTIAGALTGGLVGAVATWVHGGSDAGKKWVDNVNKGIKAGGGVDIGSLGPNAPLPGIPGPGVPSGSTSDDVKKMQAGAQGQQTKALSNAQTLINMAQKGGVGTERWALRVDAPPPKVDKAKWTKAVNEAVGAANKAIDAQMTTHKFWTADTLEKQTGLGQYFGKKIPMQVKVGTAEAMMNSARVLQSQGRLTAGQVTKLAKDIETRYGVIIPSLGDITKKSQEAATDQIKRSHLRQSAEGESQYLKRVYADFPKITQFAGQNAAQNFITEMDYLKTQTHSSNKAVADQAKKDLAVVAAQADDYGKQTKDKWLSHMAESETGSTEKMATLKKNVLGEFDDLRKKGGPKFQGIKSDAVTAFQDLQAGVVPTGSTTQKAMYEAFKAMGVNADELAKALGIAPITLKLTAYSPQAIQTYDAAKTKQLIRSGRAAGGLVQIGQPGAAGYDTVPMNVGGQNIVVGEGEQIAVLNRHQQGFLNNVLSPIGGMAGMFDKLNRPHYAAKGGIIPKFASGGVLSYGQLEGLWTQAGGAKNMAPLMAAIAEAESGGQVMAHNPSGASGLWQILGQIVPGNVFDPLTNAKNAVAKYLSQGLNAWVVYQTGAYKAFLNGNVPAIGGVGAIPEIARAIVGGPDGIAKTLAQAGADKGRAEINKYLKDHAPVASATGVVGPTSGPIGTSVFKGIVMADWVKAAMEYAQGKGVQSQPTSGYRPGFDRHTATGTSEHQGTQYPHGAVDFGDYNSGLAAKMAVVNATADFKWPLLAPIGFHDDGHASGTGHARGGLIRATTGHPNVSGGAAVSSSLSGVGTAIMGMHSQSTWVQQLNKLLGELGDLRKKTKKHPAGKHAQGLKDLAALLKRTKNLGLDGYTNILNARANTLARDSALSTRAADLVDPEAIAKYLTDHPEVWKDKTQPISAADMEAVFAGTGAVVQGKSPFGWLGQVLSDQWATRGTNIGVLHAAKQAFNKRQRLLTEARHRAKRLRDEIKHRQNRITAIDKQLHPGHGKGPTKATRTSLTKERTRLQGEIRSRQAQLVGLVGDTDHPNAVIPTLVTEIGTLNTTVGTDLHAGNIPELYAGHAATASDGALSALYGLEGPVTADRVLNRSLGPQALINALPGSLDNWYGDIGDTLSAISGFRKNYFTAPEVTTPPVPVDQYKDQLDQWFTERAGINFLQGSIAPFGGSFAQGGFVPGPSGAQRTVIAHGGEYIVPEDSVGMGGVDVHFHGKAQELADLMDMRIEQKTRVQARGADRHRRLPGNQYR